MDEEILRLFQVFETFSVRYLVVGGFAVNRHGYNRHTGDLDLYLEDTPENRRSLIEALDRMGYGRFEPLMTVPILAGYCEIILDSGLYADLMTDIPGLDQKSFQAYWEAAHKDQISGTTVPFISYRDLLINKTATNRAKDRIDVEELRRIHGDAGLSDPRSGA